MANTFKISKDKGFVRAVSSISEYHLPKKHHWEISFIGAGETMISRVSTLSCLCCILKSDHLQYLLCNMNDVILTAGKLVMSKVTSAFPAGTLSLPLTAH